MSVDQVWFAIETTNCQDEWITGEYCGKVPTSKFTEFRTQLLSSFDRKNSICKRQFFRKVIKGLYDLFVQKDVIIFYGIVTFTKVAIRISFLR